MKSRKGMELGHILTSFPSLIIVFVIMLLFVIVSVSISNKSFVEKEGIANYFADNFVRFNGDRITVKEAIEKNCVWGRVYSMDNDLREILVEEFYDRYGYGYSFALATYRDGPFSNDEAYYVHSKFGVFDELKIEDDFVEVSASDFAKVFDSRDETYSSVRLCKDITDVGIYVINRGENES